MALRYTRHSWSSVCVFFFFSHWFRIYLNISEIVFVIVHNENFRETRKSNFWIQCFGNNCPKTWSYIKTGIKGKQFIRMWFRCHAHVRWVRSSIFFFDEPLVDHIIFRNHWRLGIIEKPGEFLKGNTWGTHFKFGGYTKHPSAFHILDSIRAAFSPINEGKWLQNLLLKHFNGANFSLDCITTCYAQVNGHIYMQQLLFIKRNRFQSNWIRKIAVVSQSSSAKSFF